MAGPAEFKGKAAFITGGSDGTGLHIAEQLAGAGAHVFINGRSCERGGQAEAKLREISQDARFIAGDCASYQDAAAVVDSAAGPPSSWPRQRAHAARPVQDRHRRSRERPGLTGVAAI